MYSNVLVLINDPMSQERYIIVIRSHESNKEAKYNINFYVNSLPIFSI